MTGRMGLGILGLDLAYLAAGLGLLVGLGFVRSSRSAVRYVGLALFTGWAGTAILASWAATAGAALTVPEILGLQAALLVGGLALLRLRLAPIRRPALPARGVSGWVAAGGAAVLVVYLEELFRRARLDITTNWDAWGFWIPKAESILYRHGISAWPSFTNPDYPPLSPVSDAVTMRFAGGPDPAVLSAQHWVLAVAFVGAVAGLLASRVPPVVLWPSLALLALMPSFGDLVGSSLGDETLALLLAAAGIAGAMWLLEHEPRYAVLCGIFASGAALAKVEGLPGSLLFAAMLLVAGGHRTWRAPVAIALAAVLADLPWRVWLHVHHVVSNSAFPYARIVDPAYLAHRVGRLDAAVSALPGYVFSVHAWLLAVPIALVLGALVARRRPSLAVLVWGTTVLALVGLATIYWISPLPVHWYISTSAPRVVSSTVIFCAALAPLLFTEAFSRDR